MPPNWDGTWNVRSPSKVFTQIYESFRLCLYRVADSSNLFK